jgi:hypothetical protein
MVYRNYFIVRFTHLPSGATAQVDLTYFPRGQRTSMAEGSRLAKRILLSKLYRPAEQPNPQRSYYLNPPWDIEPFVKQGDVRLAVGYGAIRKMLDGFIPPPSGFSGGTQL